jgi:hypothetical protein
LQEHVTSILLEIGKHKKNLIKKIISKQVNIPYRSILGIKLKFRKQVLNYHSGYEGTRKYFDDLGLQRRNPEEIVHMPHQEVSIQMQVKNDRLFSTSIY